MAHTTSTSKWRPLLAVASTLVAPALPAASQAPATCNGNDAPVSGGSLACYANVPDILNGKTKLLPNDDLIVNTTTVGVVGDDLIVFPSGGNLWTTNSSVTSNTPTSITNPNLESVSNPVTLQGRLFAVAHDQVLSASVNADSSGALALFASLEADDTQTSIPALPAFANVTQLYGAAADFVGNGYAQMILVGAQPGTPGQLVLQALAADDPLIQGNGIIVGTALPISTNQTVFAVTAGVFTQPSGNATGPARPAAWLAILSTNPSTNQGLQVTFYALDPTLTITQVGPARQLSLPPQAPATPSTIAIAAGRFTGSNHDQLAIAYPLFESSHPVGAVGVSALDFDQQGSPNLESTSATTMPISIETPSSGYSAVIYLAKGAFNWASGSDQLGISVGTDGRDNAYIGVMRFNSELEGTMGSYLTYSSACHFGLAAGNFDSGSFNLQLADTATNCGPGVFNANIFNVDPTTFALTLASSSNIGSIVGDSGPPTGAGALAVSLIAGDEQGRSLVLGPPEKLTVSGHFQPDVVLELPPMHVDWVVPEGGTGLGVTNISVFPPMFNVAYAFSESSSSNVSRSTKTSFTYSTKESASEGASYGFAGDKVSVTATQAATQLHQNTVSKSYDTNTGLKVGFGSTTLFDDVVLATESQFNIYSYPVLGQCDTGPIANGICPANGSPLYVQYSGADNVEYTSTGVLGANEEFYQPVHESGNIFSYPGSVGLLQQEVEEAGVTFTPLSATNNIWDPQVTSSTSVTWSEGSTQGQTVGSTSTHSFNASVSASGSVSFEGFGASVSGSFDYNDSSSLSTLNQNTNSFDSSTGITVHYGVGSSATNPAYDYEGNTLSYGQKNPNVVQTDLMPPTAIQTQGYLVAAHTVDMLSRGLVNSGAWWSSTYNVPDVALNHPARWQTKAPGGTLNSQATWFNCPYGYTSSYTSPACAMYTPDPAADPPTVGIGQGSFYMMKGLFITPGGTSNGPQTTSVQQGNSLSLRARVYNYSLANFPPGAELNVEFYAQQWDGVNGRFLAGSDAQGFSPAVYLGAGTTQTGGTLAPPSAFCGGATEDSDPCTATSPLPPKNYVDAYITWDTTSNSAFVAGTYWRIWVVVWVVGSGGTIESELAGHGLASAPPTSGPFQNPSQVPIEVYSNNLGIYNQTIAINAASASAAASGAAATTPKTLALGRPATRNNAPILRGVPTTIVTPHIASGDHIDDIFTEYFDGDPAQGGTLFDAQHIPRVISGLKYLDTARYRAETCGQHRIFVRAIPTDGSARTATVSRSFKVTDDPVVSIDSMIAYIESDAYPPLTRMAMLRYLNEAKSSFEGNRTLRGAIQIKALLKFVKSGVLSLFHVPPTAEKALRDQLEDLISCL